MSRLELDVTEWRRVSPRYVWVDLVGMLIAAIIVVGATSLPAVFTHNLYLFTIPASLAIIFIIARALTPRRVRAIGYQLRSDDLLFRKGLMFQRFVSVPYGRMQLVDINRGPLDRALGLSELKFVTAAAATGAGNPGLPEAPAARRRHARGALAESRRAGL